MRRGGRRPAVRESREVPTTDDEGAAGRERSTEQVKEKKYFFQPQWLT